VTTEESLLKAIRRGDSGAQRELYSRYAGIAMSVGMRYMANKEDARDVLQDSFVKILTSISRFSYRGEGSLKAWVTRIVANEAISQLRRKQHLRFVDDDNHEALAKAADDEEPDIGGMRPEALMQLIGQLPTGYRTVLNLFAIEGRSHAEIAQQLGIRETSSASQFFHAKKLLREMISEYLNSQKR
jgi:RNA polymerase sigma-70 factor (ECF subfamily)